MTRACSILAPVPVLAAGLLAAGLLASGCWWNPRAPMHPHGIPDIDMRKAAETPPRAPEPRPRSAAAGRVIVMPIWNNEAPNPVGALYDYHSWRISPIARTFSHPDLSVPIWEGCVDHLRSVGLRAYKDYSDVGNPALVKRPARAAGAVLLTGRLVRALHDQVREDDGERRFEAGFVEVAFELRDLEGKTLWRGRKTARFKTPYRPGLDLLDALGRDLGRQLAEDGGLSRVLASAPGARALAAREVRR
jgi:hypothetical protein